MQQWRKVILHRMGKETDWKTKQQIICLRDKENKAGYSLFFFALATG